ncbi:MAG TPA: rRNA adenine N-6-methyltransferase family protein [archaeon]|nr:rRNA adenine N-6-methyltransferase family protein [archaeon]
MSQPGLDQHFMTDQALVKKIVALAGIRKGETVLEIGAGKGTVTKEIAKKATKVIAVEIDSHLEPFLKGVRGPNVEVRFENALDFLDSQKPEFDRIISNTPYSICEALVRRLPHFTFKKGVFAFPKSFAYKLLEKGEKRTRLSFLAQEFFQIKLGQEIPKTTFSPVPKTSSVIVVFTPKKKRSLAAALLMREKMLLKNALREAICEGILGRKSTKREAKKAIKALNLSNTLLEKKVGDLDEKEFKQVATIVKRIRF